MNTCLHVRPSLRARCSAVARLIRPQDVRSHAMVGLQHAYSCHGGHIVEGMACYLVGLRLKYIADPKAKDFWCPPLETLARQGGDCDDFSILAASLLRAANVPTNVVLGWWRQSSGRGYHAWVAGAVSPRARFVLEPQTAEVWWNRVPPTYDAEFVVGPERCTRVNRHLVALK